MNDPRLLVARRFLIAIVATWCAIVVLALSADWQPAHATGCKPEPESEWAPLGYICPPIYGEGDASGWDGPGVARNDCTYPWTACPPIRITNLDRETPGYGTSIVVTPTMWCHCFVNTVGPNGETWRIVDLDPAARNALGLTGFRLWQVRVEPASQSDDGGVGKVDTAIPDTALSP